MKPGFFSVAASFLTPLKPSLIGDVAQRAALLMRKKGVVDVVNGSFLLMEVASSLISHIFALLAWPSLPVTTSADWWRGFAGLSQSICVQRKRSRAVKVMPCLWSVKRFLDRTQSTPAARGRRPVVGIVHAQLGRIIRGRLCGVKWPWTKSSRSRDLPMERVVHP